MKYFTKKYIKVFLFVVLGVFVFGVTPVSALMASASASVTVTAPNGGECFTPGSKINIAWITDANHVAIAYRMDTEAAPLAWSFNSSAWNIKHNPSGSSFEWTIPSTIVLGPYKIWIEGHDGNHATTAPADSSNNPFGFATSCSTMSDTAGSTTSDTQAPTMPGALTLSVISSGQINLSWPTSADNVGVAKYKIFRNDTFLSETSNLTYSDTSLNASTSYSYYVKAIDAAGNVSTPNATVSATTQAAAIVATGTATDTTAPSTPLTPTISPSTSSSIKISFLASTDNVGVTAYKLYRCACGNTSNMILLATISTLNYTDNNLSASTTYTYTVAAVDAAGNVSPQSPGASGTTFAGTTAVADTTPPSVVQFGNMTDSLGHIRAGASFSEAIKNDDVNTSTVYIIEVATGNKVNCVVSAYHSGVDCATSLPATSGVDYKLVVKGIKDLAGNTMTTDYISPVFRKSDTTTLVPLATITPIVIPLITSEPTVASSLNKTKIISGSVTFSNGQPVMDARVGAYNVEFAGSWVDADVNSDGTFSLDVSGGIWRVGVTPKSENSNWSASQNIQTVSFVFDNSVENKKINFSIPLASSTLSVKAVDDKNMPLSGVGIMLDSIGAGGESATKVRFTDIRITDKNGVAHFNVISGSYYIRGYTANNALLNPKEQAVNISGVNNSATLIFGLRSTIRSTDVTITGKVYLNDGTSLGGVLVGAWSEAGESRSVTTASDGTFSMTISKTNRWHFMAVKEIAFIPYKSTDIVLETNEDTATLDLHLVKFSGFRLIAPVTEIHSVERQAVVKIADGTKVVVEPNAASGALGGTVNVIIKPTVEVVSQAGVQVIGLAYDISMSDSYGTQLTEFKKKIEITLPYDEKILKDEKITAEQLKIAYFSEKLNTWVMIDDYTLNKDKKVLVARVDHLTRFAIVSAADITPPLAPSALIATLVKAKGVQLAWVNPKSDFDHVKVYRSLKAKELGSVIAPDVTKEVFVDDTTLVALIYYYTVRAVDPAGNESTNTNQIKAVGVGKIASAAVVNKVSRILKLGSRGTEVKLLQKVLIIEKFLAGKMDGKFGKSTQKALIAFQEKYASDILTPLSLSKGDGVVGKATRIKLNQILETLPR